MTRLAAIVIGRNEAAKLPRCLSSVLGCAAPIVFVDSGSADGSADLARTMGVDVVELAPSAPFTVARARNAGLARALQLDPQIVYIQFVDADSEIVPSWFARASGVLNDNPDAAVVYGRLREREPHRSVYARLYQAEFEQQFSQPETCSGMAMMRAAAVQQVDGFNSTMVGFEDVELSFRLRQAGWQVLRVDTEMAVHEAGMTRLGQWWQRQTRSGYARAHQVTIHGGSPEPRARRESRSIWVWGVALPVLALTATLQAGGLSLLLLAAYPAFFLRIYRREQRGRPGDGAALYAASCVLGKFPQAVGQMQFHAARLQAWLRRRVPH
jgi:GT2 family glycosyltransferase